MHSMESERTATNGFDDNYHNKEKRGDLEDRPSVGGKGQRRDSVADGQAKFSRL